MVQLIAAFNEAKLLGKLRRPVKTPEKALKKLVFACFRWTRRGF